MRGAAAPAARTGGPPRAGLSELGLSESGLAGPRCAPEKMEEKMEIDTVRTTGGT